MFLAAKLALTINFFFFFSVRVSSHTYMYESLVNLCQYSCHILQIPLAPMGFLAPVSVPAQHSALPRSTAAKMSACSP